MSPHAVHLERVILCRGLGGAALAVLLLWLFVSPARAAEEPEEAEEPQQAAAEAATDSSEVPNEDAGEADDVATVDNPPPPVGVRLGQSLEAGDMRIRYSWERTHSQGMRSGQRSFSPDRSRADYGYTSTPRSLDATVHRFQLAYAPHARVTLVAELPFVQKEFERGEPFATGICGSAARCQVQTEGVGDIGFAMIVPFIRKGHESSQVHLGIDVPTGSIRRGDRGSRLPYDAQIGNGTVDLEWGWTYKGELERFAWGAQALGRHPVGRNGLKYREGSRFTGRIWAVADLIGGWSISLRGEWEKQNEIEGFDRALDPSLDPSNDPEKRDGQRIVVAPGMSLRIPALAGQRVGIEVGIPVFQDLDGPQLERSWSARMAWQWVY